MTLQLQCTKSPLKFFSVMIIAFSMLILSIADVACRISQNLNTKIPPIYFASIVVLAFFVIFVVSVLFYNNKNDEKNYNNQITKLEDDKKFLISQVENLNQEEQKLKEELKLLSQSHIDIGWKTNFVPVLQTCIDFIYKARNENFIPIKKEFVTSVKEKCIQERVDCFQSIIDLCWKYFPVYLKLFGGQTKTALKKKQQTFKEN